METTRAYINALESKKMYKACAHTYFNKQKCISLHTKMMNNSNDIKFVMHFKFVLGPT